VNKLINLNMSFSFCNQCQISIRIDNKKSGLLSHHVYHHPENYLKNIRNNTAPLLHPFPSSCFDCGKSETSIVLKHFYESKRQLSKTERERDIALKTGKTGFHQLELVAGSPTNSCIASPHCDVSTQTTICMLCDGLHSPTDCPWLYCEVCLKHGHVGRNCPVLYDK
jgi:hypothetical protein